MRLSKLEKRGDKRDFFDEKVKSNYRRRKSCKKENRRIDESEDNGIFYRAYNADFEVRKTDYNSGELDYVNSFDMKCACTAKSLEDLLDEVKHKLYMYDKDFEWFIDTDTSSFRVSYLGNSDSDLASESEIEEWKRGKQVLYNIDGYISVRKVMGEMDVPENEMRELAKKTNTELM